MSEYKLHVPEVHYVEVEVEADSLEDAINRVLNWNMYADSCVTYFSPEYSHTLIPSNEHPWHILNNHYTPITDEHDLPMEEEI